MLYSLYLYRHLEIELIEHLQQIGVWIISLYFLGLKEIQQKPYPDL
jgi:hypothetical protein